jgi:hypothetical protein
MAAADYARGRTISVEPVPREMLYFSLAKEFQWLPDEIDRQEPRKIKGVMHVLSIYNNIKNQEIEQANRKAKRR